MLTEHVKGGEKNYKAEKINILRRKGKRANFIDDAKFNYNYNLG